VSVDRLKVFLHRPVDAARLADRTRLEVLGARLRYSPEELGDFDEFELAFPLPEGREMTVSVAVEMRRVERIIVGQAPAGDDDADVRALEGDDLAAALAAAGPSAAAALAWLTADAAGPAPGPA
jgi:hypothetical protein